MENARNGEHQVPRPKHPAGEHINRLGSSASLAPAGRIKNWVLPAPNGTGTGKKTSHLLSLLVEERASVLRVLSHTKKTKISLPTCSPRAARKRFAVSRARLGTAASIPAHQPAASEPL